MKDKVKFFFGSEGPSVKQSMDFSEGATNKLDEVIKFLDQRKLLSQLTKMLDLTTQ